MGKRKNCIPFEEAKKMYQKIAKENNITSKIQWEKYLQTHKPPQNLPCQAQTAYSKDNLRKKNEKEI